MTFRHRYLTADGEVLYGTHDHGESITLARRDLTRTVTVEPDDPCAWEAPDCPTCSDASIKWAPHGEVLAEYRADCPDCDGTGVDETTPASLIAHGWVWCDMHQQPHHPQDDWIIRCTGHTHHTLHIGTETQNKRTQQ